MSETMTKDNLIAGGFPVITKTVQILAGVGALVRGTVLGRITKGAASKAAAGAGAEGANTGNGTLTLDSTAPILAGALPGTYIVRIIRAAIASPAMKAIASIVDPLGRSLGTIEVATSSGTAFANQIKFVIVDGSTPFVAGDGFTVTIAAGSGKLKPVNSANVDGSESPYCVLAEAVPASDSDQYALAYMTGTFNTDVLVFGGSDTFATHENALRAISIFGKDALGA